MAELRMYMGIRFIDMLVLIEKDVYDIGRTKTICIINEEVKGV